MTSVMVVDDHPMIRDAMRMYIERAVDLDWIGQASGGAEAIRTAGRLKPDVVLMDLQLPEVSGAEATAQIIAENPEIAVLACTTFSSESQVARALRAGAAGYIVKDADREDILEALRQVAEGSMPLSRQIAELLALDVRTSLGAAEHALSRLPAVPNLPCRERQTLELLARGMSNREIADAMVVEERTIKAHIGGLNRKLMARDRVQLLLRAFELGLVDPGFR